MNTSRMNRGARPRRPWRFTLAVALAVLLLSATSVAGAQQVSHSDATSAMASGAPEQTPLPVALSVPVGGLLAAPTTCAPGQFVRNDMLTRPASCPVNTQTPSGGSTFVQTSVQTVTVSSCPGGRLTPLASAETTTSPGPWLPAAGSACQAATCPAGTTAYGAYPACKVQEDLGCTGGWVGQRIWWVDAFTGAQLSLVSNTCHDATPPPAATCTAGTATQSQYGSCPNGTATDSDGDMMFTQTQTVTTSCPSGPNGSPAVRYSGWSPASASAACPYHCHWTTGKNTSDTNALVCLK